jgi:hypothetical protein
MAPLLSLLGLIELCMLASECSPTIGLPVQRRTGADDQQMRKAQGPALHRGPVSGMAVPSIANPWRTVSEARREAGGRLAAKSHGIETATASDLASASA